MEGSDCPEDVCVLLSLLAQGDPAEREQAARSLGTCGERARVAVPMLIKALLTDPASPVHVNAGLTLCSIHINDEDGPTLLVGLKESAASSDAVRALGHCLSDEDTRVRERAAWALMWLVMMLGW
jgi:HEAT repeat protein